MAKLISKSPLNNYLIRFTRDSGSLSTAVFLRRVEHSIELLPVMFPVAKIQLKPRKLGIGIGIVIAIGGRKAVRQMWPVHKHR